MANFTKKAIKDTFISLLKTKPFNQITVKDIVDECGVNRNTFYYHYEDINDLLEQARSAGYFDLEEIAFAIMEVNGKISFLAKDMYRQPTKKDLKVKTNNDSLSANIIIDSKLMKENIFNTDRDLDWFISQLKVKGYETYEKILLATYKDNKITIYEKDYSEPNDVLE